MDLKISFKVAGEGALDMTVKDSFPMIHNNSDHGYGWNRNHWITRNYDLKTLDHGSP